MALSDIFTGPNIVDLASGVLGITGAGSASRRAQDALGPTSFDAQYQQLAQQLQTLTGQLADTSNPEFARRVSEKTDQIMQSYEQAIRSQQARQANLAGRGLGGFNSERRDEGLSRSLAQAKVNAEAQARAEVTNEMLTAAKATGLGAQTAGLGVANERARRMAGANVDNAYDQARKAGFLQLGGALLKGVDFKKLAGAFGPSQTPTGMVQGENPFGNLSNIEGMDFGPLPPLSPGGGAMFGGIPSFPTTPGTGGPGTGGPGMGGWEPPPVVDTPYTQLPGFDVGNIGSEWDAQAFEMPTFDMFSQPDFTAGYY